MIYLNRNKRCSVASTFFILSLSLALRLIQAYDKFETRPLGCACIDFVCISMCAPHTHKSPDVRATQTPPTHGIIILLAVNYTRAEGVRIRQNGRLVTGRKRARIWSTAECVLWQCVTRARAKCVGVVLRQNGSCVAEMIGERDSHTMRIADVLLHTLVTRYCPPGTIPRPGPENGRWRKGRGTWEEGQRRRCVLYALKIFWRHIALLQRKRPSHQPEPPARATHHQHRHQHHHHNPPSSSSMGSRASYMYSILLLLVLCCCML